MSDRETITITAEDVATLDLGASKINDATPRPLSLEQIKVGQELVLIDGQLNLHPAAYVAAPYESNDKIGGMRVLVVAVDPVRPGKAVAVYSKAKLPGGHSCDGRVPHGHGLYIVPEQLYTPEAHAAHTKLSDHMIAETAAIVDLIKAYES